MKQITEDELRQLGSYWKTKILLVALRLNIFTHLSTPTTAATLAHTIGADEAVLKRLLAALVASGLLTQQQDQYQNTPIATEHLMKGTKFWYWAQVDDLLWHSWEQLEHLIRTGDKPASLFADPQAALFLSLALYQGSFTAWTRIASEVDLHTYHTLLDVGGGIGGSTIALCLQYPHLRATIVDMPGTVFLLHKMIEKAGLTGRVRCLAGDVTTDPLLGTFDVIIVSHLIHWLEEQDISRLFRNVYAALADDGVMLVRDFFLPLPAHAPPEDIALFNMFLLVQGGSRCFTVAETIHLLTNSGFTQVQEQLPGELILAQK
jgi:cyclopropane fatty-acyl-phospholipid synthase-like methyltransferase